MPTVASYVEAAKAALIAGDADQAALYCQHVLDHYPKHVEATCLLAEALRDSGEAERARDLYLRVVSADPTNLVAHWALSLIAESERDAEWALWEISRAWEASPGQPELRQEIQRLTSRKPELTAFALANVYIAGGLLEKATVELQRLHAEEPERIDVSASLAEAFWRAGQGDPAADLCRRILDDSPDCLEANLLLGHRLYDGAPEERDVGRQLLEHARQLEPSGATAGELFAGLTMPDVLAGPAASIPPLPVRPRPGADAATVVEPGAASSAAAGRTRADAVTWLQDDREQAASVQEAIEARLAAGAVQRSAAESQLLQDLDPEWQDLLNEEITLDDESEQRLSVALSEMGFAAEPAEEGWVEVPTNAAVDGKRVTQVARDQPAPAASGGAPIGRKESPAAPEPTLDRALALWRGGDAEAALANYRELLQRSPESAEGIVDGVRSLIRAFPEAESAHRVLGDAYMRCGRFQQAIEEFNWVLAKRRGEPQK